MGLCSQLHTIAQERMKTEFKLKVDEFEVANLSLGLHSWMKGSRQLWNNKN